MQSNLDNSIIAKLKILEDKINNKEIDGEVVIYRGLETCMFCKEYVGIVKYSCKGRHWTMHDIHNLINHDIKLGYDFEEFIDDLIK